MKLDLFKKIPEIPEDKLHPKFKILRDNVSMEGERKILIDWTDEFIDRDNKIVSEFQTTFHSSFWEFYLFRFFIDSGFQIDFSHNRPDFMITLPIEINIEAIVSNIKQDGRPESTRNFDDIFAIIENPFIKEDYCELLNESIVRNSNAILSKSNKYIDGYSKCKWIKQDTPFIIALSSYDHVNYGREYYYPLLALLYGLYFNPETKSFDVITEIMKPGTTSPIPVGLFTNSNMEHISATLFSCTVTFGKLTSLSISQSNSDLQMNKVINIRNDYEPPFYKIQEVSAENPEELSDGLFIFHNPYAKVKLSKDTFKNTNVFQVTFDNRKLEFEGENLPIVTRLNLNKYLFPDILLTAIDLNYNWK
jgi:hypothetical protein